MEQYRTSSDDLTEPISGTGVFSSYTRGLMWQATSKSVDLQLETIYSQLCHHRGNDLYRRLIQRDLPRTFPGIDMFKQENGPGQMAMYRILVAYSLYDAQVGYCQGLAFLVGPLLMNMPEPQAFCVFVRMMNTYGMRSMFTLKMEGLHLRLYQFSCLLKELLPNLATHLDKHAVHPAMYASQWFLTVFAYVFPMELVTKIYDMLFVEGATETIMRLAIAMLQRSEQALLMETEFEDLLDGVATRKLCTPYDDDWTDVINDAMALSNKITRQKLAHLESLYEDQEKHQAQVDSHRLGKFWRRRKVSKKSASSDTNEPGDPTSSTNQDLLDALTRLQREHNRTVDELIETRLGKKTVENELEALKMTMIELERRQPPSDATLDDQQPDGKTLIKSPSKSISCRSGHKKSLSLSSSASTLINFTPSPPPTTKKIASGESASLLSTMSWASYDTNTPQTNHFKTCSCDSDTGINDSKTDMLDTSMDEWDALRTELVRAKVAHFESQQQCERLEHELMDYHSRLDMVNEGQMALMDKLVRVTSELDEVLQAKQRYDEKWFYLVQENGRLTLELEQQQHKHQEPTSLSASYLKAKIYHLETSLAATRTELGNLELSSDHQGRLGNTASQQCESSSSISRLAMDSDEKGNDPLLEARTVGNGRIGRSVTLYGRMWHAISPRTQTIGSPCY